MATRKTTNSNGGRKKSPLSPSQKNPNFARQDISDAFYKAYHSHPYAKSPSEDEVNAVRKMFRRVQNRILTIKQYDVQSQAVTSYDQLLAKYSMSKKALSGLSRKELYKVFYKLEGIEQSKSSTVKGAYEVQEDTLETAKAVFGLEADEWIDMNKDEKSALWDLFHKIKETAKLTGDPYTDLIGSINILTSEKRIRFYDGKYGKIAYIVDENGRPVRNINAVNTAKKIDNPQQRVIGWNTLNTKRTIARFANM